MASVTGYTAARMQEIEDQAVVGGSVVGDNLVLTRYNGGTINAGNVRGPIGPTGTVPSIAYCRVIFPAETVQSIPNATITPINWSTEESDALGFHSTSTNTSRLTVPSGQAGMYQISATLYYGPADSSVSCIWIQKNTSLTRYGFTQHKNDSVNGTGLHTSEPLPLDVGDYVQVMGFQNSGAALNAGNTLVPTGLASFSLVRLGPL